MSPMLLAPAGLAALAAVALPLLIHLARRTERRLVDFAALRWLSAVSRPRRRPRFDEWPLLAARLTLLAWAALWLARPALIGAADRRAWVALAPGVDPTRVAAMMRAGARGVWLAPGFPPLDRPAPTDPVAVASLVRQLDAELAPGARLTLLVPSVIDGADAERPRLSRAVEWRVVPGRMAAPAPARSPVPTLAIRYASGAAGLDFVNAVAAALAPADRRPDIAPASVPPPGSGALIWWASGPVPPRILAIAARGRTVLVPATAVPPAGPSAVVWRDPLGAPVAERIGGIVRFVRPLAPASLPMLSDPAFVIGIRALIAPPPPLPARVFAADYRPVVGAASAAARPVATDLRGPFAVLIAATLLVERWLATRRRRAPAP